MRSLLRNRKGITMTEVVIAMAVVIIVTGAAISLVASSVQFDAKYEKETYALNACESAVCCVRFADDWDIPDDPDDPETNKDLKGYLKALDFTVDNSEIFTYGDGVVEVRKNEGSWTVLFNGEIIYEKN